MVHFGYEVLPRSGVLIVSIEFLINTVLVEERSNVAVIEEQVRDNLRLQTLVGVVDIDPVDNGVYRIFIS